MKCAAGLSNYADTEDAIQHVIEQLHPVSSTFDFVIAFFTPHHNARADAIARAMSDEFSVRAVIGCSAQGVIGHETEIETGPGLSVLAGVFDAGSGQRVHAVHLSKEQWQSVIEDAETFADQFGIVASTQGVIGMGDPWTTPINPLLNAFDTRATGVPLIGGMASGAQRPGQNVLLFNDARFDEGFVALAISGQTKLEPVVSQGCRPIGRPLVITRARENVIEQLGGRPTIAVLEEIVNGLHERDRKLIEKGLLIGRAVSEYKETFIRGDFVIRAIIGADASGQSLAIGDRARVGQTVQFHVRDADTAHEDLNLLLATRTTKRPAGALCFSCNGRGQRLFDKPHHDALTCANLLPGTPIAGFFAAGELGPVGGKNFIHGYTASLALLE